jgi:disulfide bond formation protein DsbB
VPSADTATTFFLILTVAADAFVAVALAMSLAAAVSSRARARVRASTRELAPQALPAAWIVAVVATSGSLYYSESADYVPCLLCWYQRIAMYPLVAVLGVSWLRRDRGGWLTALPFVAVGVPLAFYHWLVERVPSLEDSVSCSVTAPCSVPYFERIGFVTLAWMSFSAFALVGVLLAIDAIGSEDAVEEESSA